MKTKKAISKKQPQKNNDIVFYIFAGFFLLFLPVFYLQEVLDLTQSPRLLALSIFMLIFGLVFYKQLFTKQLDYSMFRFSILPISLAYWILSLLSLLLAIDVKEGAFDIIKTFTFIVLVFIGSSLFIRTENWQVKFSNLVLYSALIACIIGFVQYYTRVIQAVNPLLDDNRPVVYAVDGVQSHKNLFSLQLFMVLPFLAFSVYKSKGRIKVISVVVLMLTLIMLVLLKTRAVWLGTMVSLGMIGLILLVANKTFTISHLWRRIIASAFILFVIGLVAAFMVKGNSHQNSYLSQLKSISDPNSEQNIYRLRTWSLTTDMIKDNFIKGVGAGNWKINAPRYFNGRYTDKDELNWIQPHNDFLWVLAEKGIFGLLLFLAIFLLMFYYLFQVIRKGKLDDKVLSLCLLGGILGYMIASSFDFPYERVHHQVFLALMFAVGLAMYSSNKSIKPLNFNKLIFIIPFFILYSYSTLYSYASVHQEIYAKRAQFDASKEAWQSMLNNAFEAETIYKDMDPTANPIESYKGMAYYKMGKYDEAIKCYKKADAMYPGRLVIITSLSTVYSKAGMNQEAEACIQNGLKYIPRHSELLKTLCDVYYAEGQFKKAYETFTLIDGWEKDSAMVRNMRFLKTKF